AGKQVELAEEAGGAVADDFVAGRIEDRHFALTDGDERIGGISHPVEHVAHACSPLLASRGKCRQLRGGQRRTGGSAHRASVAARSQSASSARKHPRMWSLTTPTFCMNAYTLVGPTKRYPCDFNCFANASACGVDLGRSARDRGDG